MTTKRQREIIKAVWEWIEDTGEVPSQRQLIDHLVLLCHISDSRRRQAAKASCLRRCRS